MTGTYLNPNVLVVSVYVDMESWDSNSMEILQDRNSLVVPNVDRKVLATRSRHLVNCVSPMLM